MRKIGLSLLMLLLFIPFPASAQGNDAQFLLSIARVIDLPEPYCWATGVAIGNLTNDPGNEVVIGGGTDYSVYPVIGKMFAFDLNDQIIWTHTAPAEEYVAGVDIGDVDNDSDNEIAAGYVYKPLGLSGQKSRAELLDHEGNLIWGYDMSQHSNYTRIARIGNVTDHPGKEIFLGSNWGWAVLLNSSGGLIWEREIGVINLQSARIADIDNDGQNEIVPVGGWGNYGDIRALDKNGNEKWRLSVCQDAMGVGIGEIDQQSPGLEIAVACAARKDAAGNPIGSNKVTLVSSQGTILWQISYYVQVWSATTGDIDGNGINEILIGYGNHDVAPPSENELGGVAALDKEGNVIADLKLPSSVKMIEFGDANDDGKNEILASCDCGKAYVIAAVPKPDLVLHYPLESSFDDNSSYKNHGTAYGNPVFEVGKVGIGLRLDGVDDYVNITDTPELSGGYPFVKTVMAWFKLHGETGLVDIIGKQKDATYKDWGFGVMNGKLRYFSESKGEDYLCEQTTGSVTNGVWYHAAFVADEPYIYLYLNGTLVGNCLNMSNNSIDTDAPVQVGAATYGSRYSNVTIDEVRIYIKALVQSEIEEIAKSGFAFDMADVNDDGQIDINDLAAVALDFGKGSGFDPRADTDSSGKIDIFDVVFVASRFK